MRILRGIAIVSILLALLSCNIFFMTKKGRWNPMDPDNELQEFKPSIDGYVESGFVDSTSLLAQPSAKIILMRFNSGDFPDVLAASYLWMYKLSDNSGNPELEIFRIIEEWDSSITFSVANDPGRFFNDSIVTRVRVPAEIGEVQIPLGDVFKGDRDNLQNGIIIFANDETVEFEASETPYSPLLLVEPE